MGIGENIRECRGTMKQAEFADKLGVNVTTVSRWENEQNMPNGEMIQKIADVLGVSTETLLKQSSQPKVKEVNERSLKEDKGMMIYRFSENEVLELPATADFIPMFERIIAERLKMKNLSAIQNQY
ncbi:MAG: helix-turn-helix domain-containing protein [Synergistaceae bacterium]|nr:helix-turn-helix domain-containing protein [Synergistaceae bacterium]